MMPFTLESLEAERVARQAAWQAIRAAKKAGTISPPEQCQQCGAVGYTEAHHANYREPLAVQWLCRDCHRALHAVIRNRYQSEGLATMPGKSLSRKSKKGTRSKNAPSPTPGSL